MKKYFLKESNEEVKVGNKVKLTKSVETSYGKGTVITEVLVTESVLEQLIKDGFVKVQEDKNSTDELTTALEPYLRRFARVNHYNLEEAFVVLEGIVTISPRAHLLILIETIASVKNRDKEKAKDGIVYYLAPYSGYQVSSIMSDRDIAGTFYSKKDAKEAYELLSPFIKAIVNGK